MVICGYTGSVEFRQGIIVRLSCCVFFFVFIVKEFELPFMKLKVLLVQHSKHLRSVFMLTLFMLTVLVNYEHFNIWDPYDGLCIILV